MNGIRFFIQGQQYRVGNYEHIDDHMGRLPFQGALDWWASNGTPEHEITAIRPAVMRGLLEGGWDGHGEIGVYWVPPCFRLNSDTHPRPVFEVKNWENGTSIIAAPVDLHLGDADIWWGGNE